VFYHVFMVSAGCDVSESKCPRAVTSDGEGSQFFVDIQAPAPALPPRERRSTSILHWKDPAPSPPMEVQVGSLVFSDSAVCNFFGPSKEPTILAGSETAAAESSSGRSRTYPGCHRDATTNTDQNVVPCSSFSSSAVVTEKWRGENTDQCTQTDDYTLGPPAEISPTSRSVPAQSSVYVPQTVADHTGLFQSGIDSTVSGHLLTDVNGRVTSVSSDALSAASYGSSARSNVSSPRSEDEHRVGLCKRFDMNAWHVEQEKLKQLSLDSPDESGTKDDQLPDLSSSNMLSVAALRLYDSIYGGQSAGPAHRATPTRSLSSVWMRNQNQDAVKTADQSASSAHVQKAERGPCPAVHKAFEPERHVKASDVRNSQSFPSSCLPESHLAQKMSVTEWSEMADGKHNYISRRSDSGIPETYIPTDDVGARLSAENGRRLGFSERGTDSSHIDSYRWQTTATPAHVSQLAVSQAAADDAVLGRRPSIKELKVRFEAEKSSDASVRETTQLPRASFTAGYRRQLESSSLPKTESRCFRGRTGSESSQRDWQHARADTGHANIVALASSCVDSSSKKFSAPKGRFVTRSSIAANTLLPTDEGIDRAEYGQFERLVDRRKVFEAADTQPVA